MNFLFMIIGTPRTIYNRHCSGLITMSPLEGIVVIEVGHQVAAPSCSLLLADLGAEVWKIEKPGQGDQSRYWNPKNPGGAFYALNRNKKSVSLDIKHGRDVLLSMVRKADVFVENFTPGTMRRYGLEYEDISKINPRIVYCSISGYGATGPYSNRPGWDPVIQALSGYMSLIGYDGGPYVRAPSSVFDQATGMFGALGILGALMMRERTGVGSKVEANLLASLVSIMGNLIADFSVAGTAAKREGDGMRFRAPYGVFRTRTKPIYIAVANDPDWEKFCHALGLQKLLSDERFSTASERIRNKAILTSVLEENFAEAESDEILDKLLKIEIPCSPVNTIPEALMDPHIAEHMIEELPISSNETVKISAIPFKLSGSRPPILSPPKIGEHTDLILEKCGYGKSEISNLRSQGIL